MNHSHREEYLKKYPGGRVSQTEDSFDVHCAGGHHRVAVRKNGLGVWTDVSEQMGCVDSHCVSKKDDGSYVTPAKKPADKKSEK